jgi:hypothetical protein
LLLAEMELAATSPATYQIESVRSFTAHQHRLNFYVVLRKLIAKLQAFSQRIQETSMVRFYSSIYSDDKNAHQADEPRWRFSCDPPPNRCRTSNEDRMPRQRSLGFQV